MGLQYLIIGCFFLLNPYFSIIDIIPDFIGCIFLLKGLSKLTKISLAFEDAYRQFRNLLLLTLARMFTIPLITDTKEVWPLIIVFCAGLGEAFFAIRGFVQLFDGFNSTSDSPANALYIGWKEARQFTVIFLIARQVLCILPELSMLSSQDIGIVTPDGIQSMANYRWLFTGCAMLLCLVIGIAWFMQIRKYLKGIVGDEHYQAHLAKLYEERYINISPVFISANLKTALILLTAGVILSLELIFDGVNYLPHLLGAVFIALGASKLANLTAGAPKSARKVSKLAWIYGIVSLPRMVFSMIFTYRIFGDYLNSEQETLQVPYSVILQEYLARDFDTIYSMVALVVLSVLEAVLMILLVSSLYQMLREVVKAHTRLSIAPPPPPPGLENFPRPQDEFEVFMKRWLPISYVLGVVAAISMVLATAAPAFFPSYWLIDTILRCLWVFAGYYLLSKLREETESHYSIYDREDLHNLTH